MSEAESSRAGSSSRAVRAFRWLARTMGLLVAGWWLFIGIASALAETAPLTWESVGVGVMIALGVLAVVLAWWRERVGAIALIVFAVVFAVFAYITAGQNRAFAMFITGGPYLLVGLLFLASWRAEAAALGQPNRRY